jgi:DMSO/TMAO reductase YedYZ molybdopterin-dependent catalytic subunit
VKRSQRIPPGQVQTRKWPVLHYGNVPQFDRARWTFHVFGLVEKPWQCTYDEFLSLPRIQVRADMHCVTRWSKLDNLWEGVSTREVLRRVNVLPEARFVLVHCEHGFTTNLPLDDFLGEDCLFAWKHNGQDLEPDHGYPLRLVVPRLYAWKSAKWVGGIELMAEDKAGFWEQWDHGGYHMRGDPWAEQRFRE